MPKIISAPSTDDAEWLSEPSTVDALKAIGLDFLPIQTIVETLKGFLCTNSDYSVKLFIWKGKPEWREVRNVIDFGTQQLFAVVEARKYPRLAVGDEPETEGKYVPSEGGDSEAWNFSLMKIPATVPKSRK